MNRKYFLVILCVAAIAVGFTLKPKTTKDENKPTKDNTTDWEKNNLKGKVKTMFEVSYFIRDSAGIQVKGSKRYTNYLKFTPDGKVLDLGYDNAGVFSELLGGKNIFTYDKKGRILTEYDYDEDKRDLLKQLTYTYLPDEHKWKVYKIIEIVFHNGSKNDTQVVIYKKLWKQEHPEAYRVYANGKLTYNIRTIYDKNMNVLELIDSSKADAVIREKLTYDSKNNPIEDAYYLSGKFRYALTIKYDSLNRETEEICSDTNKLPNRTTRKYDAKGHLVEYCKFADCFNNNEKTIISYDLNGDTLQIIHTIWGRYVSGGDTPLRTITTFDNTAHTREIRSSFSYNDTIPGSVTKNYYDIHGHLIVNVFTEFDYSRRVREHDSTRTYFDKTGNWIKDTVFGKKTIESIGERRIQYY